MPSHRPNILILVDTSTTWGAEIIRGVDDFGQSHGGWRLSVETHGEFERLTIPRTWKGDGVVARVTQRELAKQLARREVPVVNVSWSHVPGYEFPQVMPDEAAVGRLAARHLIERGLRSFAYCGLPKQPNYVDRCQPAFVAELALAAHRCAAFEPGAKTPRDWRAVTMPALQAWLRDLPKPVGVLAWGPERGRNVIDACSLEGIRVPDDVAVVATADDELLCGISHPPLSAVDEKPRVVGYEAAATLARMMTGEKLAHGPTLVEPQRVVTRHSTDMFAVEDPEVATALRFIRDHYHEPIDVRHVLRVVAISRRALEQRFRPALGRSPAEEIRRVRLARAVELLVTTKWPVAQVARASGFAHLEGMYRVFRRELGQTPNQCRRRGERDLV